MQTSPEDPPTMPSTSGSEGGVGGVGGGGGGGGAWEIEEEEVQELIINHDSAAANPPRVPTSKPKFVDEDDVYVAVGKGNSSMDALSWALRNLAKPTGFVYLVHVFPEVHHIPTPLGVVPRAQVNKAQVDSYMEKEKMKRREMLHKFIRLCETSKMEVDTFLIESDQIVKAVLELIPVLNIRRLIVGTSKSNFRKKLKASSKAAQIQRSAPNFCEVKIICDGKEVNSAAPTPTSPTATPTPERSPASYTTNNADEGNNFNSSDGIFSCRCFKGKFL